jgi:Catalase
VAISASDIASPAPANGEIIPSGEGEALSAIVQATEDRLRAAKTRPARRSTHAKGHGCVQAEFRVLDDLPPALRVGVFAATRTYPAWIRFSNGLGTPHPDSFPDARGMAIKLMGVTQSPSTTQDFVMINYPAFFVRNATDYVDFGTAATSLRFFFPGFNPFRFRLHEMFVFRAIARQTVHNPLNARYWSMSPCCFGGAAGKFSARPAGAPSPFGTKDSPDYLRANLARHLAEAGASFDFLVQLRTQPGVMPIEDPTIIWNEDAAPFVPVASITIPRQSFDSPEQNAFCENLFFTPWHCVGAHRPLGGINRIRRTVYETMSRVRHELNGVPQREPTDFTLTGNQGAPGAQD